MGMSVSEAVAKFGKSAKDKLSNPSATGAPEDQLRAPFEQLLKDMSDVLEFPSGTVVAVGESSVSDLKTRPDYAVTVHKALVGFIELKAPGKGADPRKFKEQHDKEQWQRLHSLPNLIYSDGNEFSLWQNGDLMGAVVRLKGDIESSGATLEAPPELASLIEKFLQWQPIPPKSAKELAFISARLCRLLRDEVTEQLALGSDALTSLAADWRMLLFPDASDERFADGYAQAVTFGLLMARAKGISLADGYEVVAKELGKTSSLIGAALRLITDNAESQATLKTSLSTLPRVLDVVDWATVSKGKPEAWLYFYESFLETYDNELKKQTGSYYTPPEVVGAMVRLVDEQLIGPRFGQSAGLASPDVVVADPAMGTGTFLLAILRRIEETVKKDQGPGAVSAAINDAINRLIAFEIQLGPFAVAQLRILGEIFELTGSPPKTSGRLYVTNTLGSPYDDEDWIPGILAAIGKSRKEANKIKREQPITVVIGNPPYKEKAKGRGGWIEGQDAHAEKSAPLAEWMPPREWGVGVHSKHLRNLYVYFWRWATWKVFDHHPEKNTGIVCFITVAGFLSGPGFQKMRDYMRRTCDEIWVVDCSPEGHQPEVSTRIFQGVQHPVCIVIASRSSGSAAEVPAKVRFHALPRGHRTDKFLALGKLTLNGPEWSECSNEWRSPFLPALSGAWAEYPALEEYFIDSGSGVMPGRTWVIAPDAESLMRRWNKLTTAPTKEKEALFHPHLRGGKPGDRHVNKKLSSALAGFPLRVDTVADDKAPCNPPIRYGYRSFDRQWIIPDNRLINQPNPDLWASYSERQCYMTALTRTAPSGGPAITITGLIPDIDHYKGSFGGRVFSLWANQASTVTNLRPKLLKYLSEKYNCSVSGEDLFAYIAALACHRGFVKHFRDELATPGLRIPLTADGATFRQVSEVGRTIIWLHTYGERMSDVSKGRPPQPPRLPEGKRPQIPSNGAIPQESSQMPDAIDYDADTRRLFVGKGFIDNVDPKVWEYEVSGKQVVLQWFSYRKANRQRPVIGERRVASVLGSIQPDHWLSEYTTELINLLNVLGGLVELEGVQEKLLSAVVSGALVSNKELLDAAALELPVSQKKTGLEKHPKLFED